MARMHEFYKDTVAKQLTDQFGYTSPMQIPRITKITLNMGVGEAVGDKKVMDHAVGDMQKIAGQKPVVAIFVELVAKDLMVVEIIIWALRSRSYSQKLNMRRLMLCVE